MDINLTHFVQAEKLKEANKMLELHLAKYKEQIAEQQQLNHQQQTAAAAPPPKNRHSPEVHPNSKRINTRIIINLLLRSNS